MTTMMLPTYITKREKEWFKNHLKTKQPTPFPPNCVTVIKTRHLSVSCDTTAGAGVVLTVTHTAAAAATVKLTLLPYYDHNDNIGIIHNSISNSWCNGKKKQKK